MKQIYSYAGTAGELRRHLADPRMHVLDELGRKVASYDTWSDPIVTTSDNEDQVEAVKQEQPYRSDD